MTKTIDLPTNAARRGGGRFLAKLVGDQNVQHEACGNAPKHAYMVQVDDPTQIVSAKLQHIIWHKVPLPDTTHPMPGAIDRVLIDNEGDFATGKTPHYATIVTDGFVLPLSEVCFGTCFMSFCSTGRYVLIVQVIWLDETDQSRNKDFLRVDITVT